ncbi:MAG: YgfZ/GcvT domain-containing protein, partial [Burkholderiaceae bacterium]
MGNEVIDCGFGLSTRVVSLSSFSVIVAEGPDAEQFLQAQLTNSLQALGPEQHQLTGYCSAKGRLLAIARLWRISEDRIGLLLPTDIAPAIVKRLSMFVLRAKVRLSLAQAQVKGLWFGLPANLEAAPSAGSVSRHPSDSETFLLWLEAASTEAAGESVGVDHSTRADESHDHISGQQFHGTRALCISFNEEKSPKDAGVSASNGYPTQHDSASSASQEWAWHAADIRAGLPWVWASSQDLFVPQMVNLELLDGVNFQKGCYPGQEVVARSQYLGKLNRRMFGVCFSLNGSLGNAGLAGARPMPPIQQPAQLPHVPHMTDVPHEPH